MVGVGNMEKDVHMEHIGLRVGSGKKLNEIHGKQEKGKDPRVCYAESICIKIYCD